MVQRVQGACLPVQDHQRRAWVALDLDPSMEVSVYGSQLHVAGASGA